MLPLEHFPEGNWTTIFFEVQGTLYQEYVMCLDIFWCVFHYNNAITWAVPNDRVNSLRLFSCPFLSNTQWKDRKELPTRHGVYLFCFLFFLVSLNSVPFPYHFIFPFCSFLNRIEKSEFIKPTLFSQLIAEEKRNRPGLTSTELGNYK